MKKFFEFIGLLSLACFSFFYTDKTLSVVKQMDDIMINLENNKEQNKIESVNASIVDNTIIPGIKGKEIDINKSYKKMKKIGTYDDSLLVFNETTPKISIKNNYDKYIISGNKTKKNISLIFLVKEEDNINKILNILDDNNIKGNFFLDGNWFEDHNTITNKIIKENHVVGTLGYNNSYKNNSYIWMNTVLKSFKSKLNIYCLKTEDENDLAICAKDKNYTISPTVTIDKDPYINASKNIENGAIIAFEVNSTLNKELNLIIDKIKQKGYNIVTLDTLIEE